MLGAERTAHRVAAAQWLGDLDDPRSEALLFRALRDPTIEVQTVATTSLARRDPDRDPRPVVQALRGGPGSLEEYAPPDGPEILELGLYGLSRLEPVPRLVETLSHEEPGLRLMAARVLGSLQDKRATESLIIALNDQVAAVREAAVEALGEIGGPDATRALERFAESGVAPPSKRTIRRAIRNSRQA